MGYVWITVVVLYVIFRILANRKNRETESKDPYKEIRKKIAINSKVLKKINSSPSPHNKVGALSLVEQKSKGGKLTLSDSGDK